MVRRLLWLTLGASAGAWAVMRIQRAAAHLTPSGLTTDVQRYARHLGSDVRAAAKEAQRTKREVEAGLRPAQRAAEMGRATPPRPIEARSTDAS
jgi:hypothetical protein